MQYLLTALRAVAEPTRLRLLALCAQGELTVSELVRIVGQSQPRVSRHLKQLSDAGLLERFREGSWVFYRSAQEGEAVEVVRRLVALLPDDDAMLALDRERLAEVKRQRAAAAEAYFRQNATRWDHLRSLQVDDAEVEQAVRRLLPAGDIRDFLDVGTGTGRLLQIFGPQVERAQGIDMSHEMLNVARSNLERWGLANCWVRQGDMYQLPFGPESFDAVSVHQVLHFADRPGRVVAEAARVVRPGGRVLVVDFAPHAVEELRLEHEHRRLGFADGEVTAWLAAAGLDADLVEHLPGTSLTVTLWLGRKPAAGGLAVLPHEPDTEQDRQRVREGYP